MLASPHPVLVLATGGTILSEGDRPDQMAGYSLKGLESRDLLAALPGLDDLTDITLDVETVANIDSGSMESRVWMPLLKRIHEALEEDPDTRVVVIHGTDTLEETAFFLWSTLPEDATVVLTGAMRPASAISADGPINLWNSILAARAGVKGVSVLINDTLYSGGAVTKSHPTHVNAFSSTLGSTLGHVTDGDVVVTGAHPDGAGSFAEHVDSLVTLPKLPSVPVFVSHCDANDDLINLWIDRQFELSESDRTMGFVYAGAGNASIHESQRLGLERAIEQGFLVALSSRIPQGMLLKDYENSGLRLYQARTVWQARTLLALELAVEMAGAHYPYGM